MPEQSLDPWQIIWRFVTSDSVLVILLLAIAASVALTAWLPQRPSSDVDYARWLSQVQARFGEATSTMRALGLFNLTGSVVFRILVALLSGCLVLRLVERGDRLSRGREVTDPDRTWREISVESLGRLLDGLRVRRYRAVDQSSFYQIDRWPWADLSLMMVYSGALFLLVGLLFSYLWGWQVEGLILQRGELSTLPEGDWVALEEAGSDTRQSPGVVTFVEERGPGVHVRAIDDDGQALQLQVTAGAELSPDLLLALAEDRYFAVPEANLIARLTPRSEDPYTRVEVQVYRSPPGEMIAETMTDEGGEANLSVEGVRLELTPAPYARIAASRNPGRWPAGGGLVLLMAGLLGNLIWPAGRFWLREREDLVEAAGSLPPSLVAVEPVAMEEEVMEEEAMEEEA
jgi:hypothetical protein